MATAAGEKAGSAKPVKRGVPPSVPLAHPQRTRAPRIQRAVGDLGQPAGRSEGPCRSSQLVTAHQIHPGALGQVHGCSGCSLARLAAGLAHVTGQEADQAWPRCALTSRRPGAAAPPRISVALQRSSGGRHVDITPWHAAAAAHARVLAASERTQAVAPLQPAPAAVLAARCLKGTDAQAARCPPTHPAPACIIEEGTAAALRPCRDDQLRRSLRLPPRLPRAQLARREERVAVVAVASLQDWEGRPRRQQLLPGSSV